jgi:hypothetical protein
MSHLNARSREILERVRDSYRKDPGFASNVGASAFDWLLEDLSIAASIKAKEPN